MASHLQSTLVSHMRLTFLMQLATFAALITYLNAITEGIAAWAGMLECSTYLSRTHLEPRSLGCPTWPTS